MTLDRLQSEFEIEPIFSGAAWAGSVLWAAAEKLVLHVLLSGVVDIKGKSVLELGCGLGIPGMVASLLGSSDVLLTEQPSLLPLLRKNVSTNFKDASVVAPTIMELSWGTESGKSVLRSREGRDFDFIFICDCVFEPLYGDSWKLLCDTLSAISSPATRVIISSERSHICSNNDT